MKPLKYFLVSVSTILLLSTTVIGAIDLSLLKIDKGTLTYNGENFKGLGFYFTGPSVSFEAKEIISINSDATYIKIVTKNNSIEIKQSLIKAILTDKNSSYVSICF